MFFSNVSSALAEESIANTLLAPPYKYYYIDIYYNIYSYKTIYVYMFTIFIYRNIKYILQYISYIYNIYTLTFALIEYQILSYFI